MIQLQSAKLSWLKRVGYTLVVVGVVGLGIVFWPKTGALSPWSPGRIIDDNVFYDTNTFSSQPAIRGELGRPSMEEVRERNMRLSVVGMVHRMPACVIITKIQARKRPRLKGAVAGLLAACRWPILSGMYQKSSALTHR